MRYVCVLSECGYETRDLRDSHCHEDALGFHVLCGRMDWWDWLSPRFLRWQIARELERVVRWLRR